jgi:hypothetical protein
MARKLRFIPPGSVVEVTARTVQSRFLLKPGPGWRETFVGALARARERYRVDVHDFVCEEVFVPCELELTPLPCWADLSPEQFRAKIRQLIREVEKGAAERRRAEGRPFLGARQVLDQDPQASPLRTKRSPAPFCHAFLRMVRVEMWKAYVLFLLDYREAAARLRAGEKGVPFPPGSFLPPMPFAPAVLGVP